MSFAPRTFPAIVRDLLTTLTGGTVREPVVVPAEDPLLLTRLAERPIRRVSHLEGQVAAPTDENPDRTLPYRFTAADFQLISTTETDELDAIRFRDSGRRPAPGSTVTVNYYPIQVGPVPLTDLNVGSVSRTLLETVARELALEELQLEHVYRSAFLDTAEGSALDRVVALVGVHRLPRGHAVVKVRFSRTAGSTGRVSIPTGTVVTDADDNRFATLSPLVLEPGEPSRQVLCGAVSTATEPVDTGVIDRLEVLVAGVSSVTNEAPAYRTATPETDDDLRRRARGALQTTGRGTIDALRFGVLSIPGVKEVTITEEPNGVPGEVRLDVAYENEPDAELVGDVLARVDDLRPAGIRVLTGEAARVEVAVSVQLTLAGGGFPPTEIDDITGGVEDRLAGHLRRIAPGGTIRGAQLISQVLSDSRIVDATVLLDAGNGQEPTVALSEGAVADPVLPFGFPAPLTESPAGGPLVRSDVDAILPVTLVAGTTEADATAAIRLAIESALGGITAGSTLTVDALVAAGRDDTRYAIQREQVLVTVESEGRFVQLTDGVGSYPAASGETLSLRTLHLEVAEGGV